ncbi:MAG TPA: CPBP family glutamic-type intramembrane protease [Gemmatimonadales bacterium]|nr:CPBP family glutamic-type intramembrane protease [Gemmatimonadales bacterium]
MNRAYWRLARTPRYSLLFALPLLIAYQVLVAFEPATPHGLVRNGADVMLETVFIALAGNYGPLAFMVVLVGIGLWLVIRDVRRHPGGLRAGVFAGMLIEALGLAAVFGFIVGSLTTRVVESTMLLHFFQVERLSWPTRLMLSVGAGLYEELLFRVVLVAGLAWMARVVFGWRDTPAAVWAVLLGAAIFSVVHYIGPYGDRVTLYSFVFRMIAGMFFSALYLLRGFGITAWTHSLYDAMLLVM